METNKDIEKKEANLRRIDEASEWKTLDELSR